MRKAEVQRDTKETQVFVALDLDGRGESRLDHSTISAICLPW